MNVKKNELSTQDLFEGYNRVTEILYPYSGLSNVNEAVLANAANRGTRVHNTCEAIVRGIGVWDIDDEIKGYINSFNKWWEKGHEVVAIEKRFFSEKHKITGQVDLILKKDDGHIILDLKTSSRPSKTWALQGSAYAHMANEQGYNVVDIQFLHLSKNGIEPKIYSYPDQFDLFEKCLEIYRYFFEKKRRRKK